MPRYNCSKCSISDDEAVPCRVCGKMLLPVKHEAPPKVVKVAVPPKVAAKP